jgi:RNA polymerase sigma-70 factor (ECF subfamily)
MSLRALSPQTPALEDVFRAEGNYVWNTFRRLGVPAGDVKDLTQDLFLSLHRLLPTYDPARPIRPWLFTIAFRMAVRHRERRRRESPLDDSFEVPDSSADLDRQMARGEERDLVLRALDCIEIERRAVFILADVDEVPVPAIAAELGIPVNTAYSRLRLAREDFRKAVQRMGKGVRS